MSTCLSKLFNGIKNSRVKKLYTAMWADNSIVKNANIVKSLSNNKKESNNSFCFAGNDKAAELIKIFGIKPDSEDVFRTKFNMACSGSGMEMRRITTLHSSSLCALLFFYNVTDENELIIDGIGTFTSSVFEFKSPVADAEHPSCMDVVLTGTDINGESLVLFLESKFSEYYTSASKKLYGISQKYLEGECKKYSSHFYSESFLQKLGLIKTKKNDCSFNLHSDYPFYIGGIKQMISHYVGIRNNLDGNFAPQEKPEQEKIIEMIKDGANVYLAEIIFDTTIGDFLIGDKTYKTTCKKAYSQRYAVLADEMNAEICKTEHKNRFKVLPYELGYSMFKGNNLSYRVDPNVLEYYFG